MLYKDAEHCFGLFYTDTRTDSCFETQNDTI